MVLCLVSLYAFSTIPERSLDFGLVYRRF